MGGIYSERFLHAQGQGVNVSARVPAGHRWVLRDIVLSNNDVPAGSNLRVGGFYVAVYNFPGVNTLVRLDMRVVAYAGELVELSTLGPTTWATLSGYAFADPTGATGPPADVTERQLEFPRLMPVDAPRVD